MTTSRRGSLLALVLLALGPLAQARAATVQGITFEKASGLGIGTTVFLGGCCQTDTVAPNYDYSFPNISAGPRVIAVNLPPSYGNVGSVEYSVCTNATGACHTEASWVVAPNYITEVTVPASGFIDIWWRFSPGPPPTTTSTTSTTLVPHTLDKYVILGVSTPSKAAKVVLGDQVFVTEGSVGVNEGSPASVQFGTSGFMPDGSVVVGQTCNTDLAPSPPPSNTSLFDVAGTPGDQSPGACPGFARDFVGSFTPPILTTTPTLPTLLTGNNAYPPLVAGDATVLEAGTYTYASVKVPSQKKLLVNGPVTIYVRDSLTVGEFGNLGPNKGHAVNPNDIQVFCGNAADSGACNVVTFDRASHVGMALVAPNAKVNVNRSVRFKGQIVANFVNGDQTLLLRSARGAIVGPNTQFTTLRQDEYGATSGRANGPTGLVTQNASLLPVTVGGPGLRSLTIPDQANLECFLPAVNVAPAFIPGALCAAQASPSDNDCSAPSVPNNGTFPQYMKISNGCSNVLDPIGSAATCGNGDTACSGGQGAGTLVGQTIATKLNVTLSRAGLTNPGLGDFVLPTCLCTNTTSYADCRAGRTIDNTAQQNQGMWAGLEDGLTTVDDLIAQADEALASDCNRGGVCTNTCGTAFAPPDPIRIGELTWTLKAINECFSGVGDDNQAPRVKTLGCTCPAAPSNSCQQ